MAEERLIDEDKDRKYRIRKNEDGEEELIILDDGEKEEAEPPMYALSEDDEDDTYIMTPEQLAEYEREQREEKEKLKKKADEYLARAKVSYDEGDLSEALYAIGRAEEVNGNCGELAALKLKCVTVNFTDYSDAEGCNAAADGVNSFCDARQKSELLSAAGSLGDEIVHESAEVKALSEENEKKRAERKVIFSAAFKRACLFATFTAIPFLVFAGVALGFSTVMFARRDGAYLIVTVVAAALAAAFLVAGLFAVRMLMTARRNLMLNELDSSTELGRRYSAAREKLDAMTGVYQSIGGKL